MDEPTTCEYCLTRFVTSRYLEYHQKFAKYCHTYRYIVFTCTKCNFTTRGIRNIEKHAKCCDKEVQLANPIVGLQKRILELEKENQTYQQKLNKQIQHEQKIRSLESQLILTIFKCNLYKHIIENNTSIKLGDVMEEKEDGVYIYESGKIPIFINSYVKENEGFEIIGKKSPRKTPKKSEECKAKKQNYRSIKTCIDLAPEEDKNITIDNIDANIQEKMNQFGDPDVVQNSFETCFSKLKQSRVYTKILDELKAHRWTLFGRFSISEYTDLVTNHIDVINKIFNQKNYNEKKSISIISKSLSPLESRLVRFSGYTTQVMEAEEIQRLDTVLDLHVPSDKEFVVFDQEMVSKRFHNYGSVLFSLNKNIKRFLLNIYGYPNIIYLPLPKNNPGDPYSFYYLERIHKEKRYWKMDCRLEDFSTYLISTILPYMVSIFRRLYYDIFEDNEFRSNYSTNCQVTEFDCEQLLQNILYLAQPKEFCNLMRNIIKDNSSYTPTENDKFNLYGDDSLQRKRFQEKEDTDVVEIIKQLFDGISSEDAVDFYRSRIT